MRITVLGCGDAFGSGGHFNTSFHLKTATDRRVMVDFGATSMVALHREGIEPDSIDAIVISHLHGDHFGGIPFLLLNLHYVAQRTRPLTIAGPPGTGETLERAVDVFFGSNRDPWRFPLQIVELTPGATAQVADLSVEPFPVVHGDVTSYALRLDDSTRVFAFSGDTCWTDVLYAVADRADVFIMECYDYDRPCPTHTDWQTFATHLPDITAKRVLLTHMNENMLANRDKVSVETLADGMVIEV